MQLFDARPATTARYAFGEGVRFDAAAGMLLWVDLLEGRLHRAPLQDLDAVETLCDLDGPVGAAVPCEAGGWLLAAGRGLAHLTEDGDVTWLVELEPAEVRMNDAACDLQGRLWAGSMAWDESEGGGALYRVGLDGAVDLVVDDVTVANGPAFSPDGTTLYRDDSGRGLTVAHPLDPDTGELGPGTELVRHTRGAGDGLTVDDEGHLWVALFGGAGVHRYSPTGELVARVEVPAAQVSSCCLAEGRLYLTTVSARLDRPEPDAGRLFVADVGVDGPPVRAFRGVLPGR